MPTILSWSRFNLSWLLGKHYMIATCTVPRDRTGPVVPLGLMAPITSQSKPYCYVIWDCFKHTQHRSDNIFIFLLPDLGVATHRSVIGCATPYSVSQGHLKGRQNTLSLMMNVYIGKWESNPEWVSMGTLIQPSTDAEPKVIPWPWPSRLILAKDRCSKVIDCWNNWGSRHNPRDHTTKWWAAFNQNVSLNKRWRRLLCWLPEAW